MTGSRESWLWGSVTRGLKLLQYVLFKVKDRTHLVSTMPDHIELATANFQDEGLDDVVQGVL